MKVERISPWNSLAPPVNERPSILDTEILYHILHSLDALVHVVARTEAGQAGRLVARIQSDNSNVIAIALELCCHGVDNNVVAESILFKTDPVTPTSRGVSLAADFVAEPTSGISNEAMVQAQELPAPDNS